ncbi:MAG: cytochrome c [Deltaproteobacteria bacterium]|nr:cytochrome c [Deltaproteobacteria bacterium]
MTSEARPATAEPHPWRFLAILFASVFVFVVVVRLVRHAEEPPSASSASPAPVDTQERETSFPERGKQLFDSMGCAACHGPEGSGGVSNLNYVLGTVPPLNEMADRLMLFDPEDAAAAVELLERGADLASLEEDPPFPNYARFVAQYGAVVGVIKNGAPAAKKDPAGPMPPLQMLAWGDRLSDEDIRALLAYLIELYDWEE